MFQLLSAKSAATTLGISVLTLYDWQSQSDAGKLVIRGEPVTVDYFQGGRNGQGRIRIAAEEVERLMSLMRVKPRRRRGRTPLKKQPALQHITTKLGRPDE